MLFFISKSNLFFVEALKEHEGHERHDGPLWQAVLQPSYKYPIRRQLMSDAAPTPPFVFYMFYQAHDGSILKQFMRLAMPILASTREQTTCQSR